MLGVSLGLTMWSSDLPPSARQFVIEGEDGKVGTAIQIGDIVHFKAANGLYLEIPDLQVSRMVTAIAHGHSAHTAFVLTSSDAMHAMAH